MSTILSGREGRRAYRRSLRLKGPGYTRAWRKGRTKRYPPKPPEEAEDAQTNDS